jgi:crotonobetainyl-CoA:carnitine CoA-transferase CaiB-like acyl-CoA transferase
VTGRGQQIFVDMFGANAYANFDDLIDYPGKPARPPLGEGLRGPQPLNRLYPASSGWVFLGLRTAGEWARFKTLGDFEASTDPFESSGSAGTESGSKDESLIAALGRFFATRPADEWEALFVPAGLGCVRADRLNTGELFAGPAGAEWMVPVEHAELGTYLRHRTMVDFPAPAHLRAGARAGEHGRALLAELGFAAHEVDGLFAAGVLFSVDESSR